MSPRTPITAFAAAAPVALAGVVALAVACGPVPSETSAPPDGREITPSGVVEGSVVYDGPHPCSSNGHIVGAAIVLLFDRRNPPPPNGLATTPVNFGVVPGDVLFASEPRNAGADTFCPVDHGVTGDITASAPFAVSPLSGGSYLVEAFYDYTGDFLPTFKFRDLPEMGDIAGGDVDTVAALEAVNANPDYQPQFVPVDVGTPLPLAGDAAPGEIPNYIIPDEGFVANGVAVSLGSVITTTRPYFYPVGLDVSFSASTPGSLLTSPVQTSATSPANQAGITGTVETNPNYQPVLTIPQDIQVLAPPQQRQTAGALNNLEASYPHLLLQSGLPSAELAAGAAQPFHFQLASTPPGSAFSVWQNATFDTVSGTWVPQEVPEGEGIPSLWPLVVLTKLIDDPDHTLDPASLTEQGSATAPVVVLQAITLLGGDGVPGDGAPDSLANTVSPAAPIFDTATGQPVVAQQDHVTVLLRPAVICFDSLFDATASDKRGTLVTPHLLGTSADLSGAGPALVVPASALASPQLAAQVKGSPVEACLPVGRYAINAVVPDGQAWTVPNESGACSGIEGATDYANLTCTLQPRPVLRSQGTRAVVEIVAATQAANCQGSHAVPAACLPTQ